MFERYTERARRVVVWARYIADQRGSAEIETEDLLVGLLREDMRLARRFLGSPFALDAVWRQVVRSSLSEKPAVAGDLPLSNASKRVLAFAAEEGDQLSIRGIGTGHLLLGLLREKKCLATEILRERGVRLVSTREELARMPHDDSLTEEFVREERTSPPEVVELRAQIRLISGRWKDAFANHDFAQAGARAAEERAERRKLYWLCQQDGLADWLFD